MSRSTAVNSEKNASRVPAILLALAALGCAFLLLSRNRPAYESPVASTTPSVSVSPTVALMVEEARHQTPLNRELPIAVIAKRSPEAVLKLTGPGLVSSSPLNVALLENSVMGDTQTQTQLIKSGADVNSLENLPPYLGGALRMHGKVSPLMLAAYCGRPDLLAILLAHGAKPLLQDGSGRTAFAYAQITSQTICLRVLASAERSEHTRRRA